MHIHRVDPETCTICQGWPAWARHLYARIERLEDLMTEINSDQAHLDADVQAQTEAFATVIAELKAQHSAGTPLDFTAADALVSSMQGEATADAPPAPVEPPPAL